MRKTAIRTLIRSVIFLQKKVNTQNSHYLLSHDLNNLRLQEMEATIIKEPAVPDIEWHSRLFAIAGVMSYARTRIANTSTIDFPSSAI
jgi:hypothetical protein